VKAQEVKNSSSPAFHGIFSEMSMKLHISLYFGSSQGCIHLKTVSQNVRVFLSLLDLKRSLIRSRVKCQQNHGSNRNFLRPPPPEAGPPWRLSWHKYSSSFSDRVVLSSCRGYFINVAVDTAVVTWSRHENPLDNE
jgi:hypothetical protein